MKNICVFCGSNTGILKEYKQQTEELGKIIAQRNLKLIYGGGNVGLMGILADTVLGLNGQVVGVIPDFLMRKEVGHTGLNVQIIVQTMHERKQKMAELSDAFIVLPGGIGTMEEFFEIFTWAQLGLHNKPFAILNSGGYYHHLLAFLDLAVEHKFLSAANRNMIITDTEVQSLFTKLDSYQPPSTEKWMEFLQT
ncbi:MAG: TIGR00730 family Rossman fold protein [Sphingobacteriales bacterium]|nr:MAG: TIGR00730 family Rossman fold protein [Sphingobacteriales bacterium]